MDFSPIFPSLRLHQRHGHSWQRHYLQQWDVRVLPGEQRRQRMSDHYQRRRCHQLFRTSSGGEAAFIPNEGGIVDFSGLGTFLTVGTRQTLA